MDALTWGRLSDGCGIHGLNKDPYSEYTTLQLVNGENPLNFGVEKATCFNWLQNGDL